MKNGINRSRLFLASCMALTVTSMTFAIRAGMVEPLGVEFGLSNEELGWVLGMALFGFPVATFIGGFLYNEIGPQKMMYAAFLSHLLGLILTIFAGGYIGLLISTFLVGFANGSVEAACNPLIAEMYPKKKTAMLNKFHVWFPGGLVIGSLISHFMNEASVGWQIQVALILIPTILYAILFFGQEFPKEEDIERSTSGNFNALITSPLFWFMAFCMTLTATTELGTQGWVEKILGNTGAHPMLVLALVTGVMAVGRYFAGPVIHKLNPTGVLLMSAVLATLGIGAMSIATGPMVYIAAILFALGVMYFWPTMIGFVAENLPKTGALGMSIVGGVGMVATGIWSPIIGKWLDSEKTKALAEGLTGDAAELVAGQATLDNLATFPFILIFLFGGLYFYMKRRYKKLLA